MSLETQIADRLVALLTTNVPTLKYVAFDRVKVAVEDFKEHEVPGVQFWDQQQTVEHQRGYAQVTWGIAMELVMKQTVSGVVDQKSLWDLRRECELALWSDPSLTIPEVQHLRYNTNVTDLHLLSPFYVTRVEFDVLFRRELTGYC